MNPYDHIAEKHIATPNGDIFYYSDSGAHPADSVQAGDRTVVFLHGLSANHTTWLKLMPRFREAGFNTLAPDLRGHGKSDKAKRRENYKLEVFTEDLKQILDKENIRKIILVGYSFGGLIALDFADKYPDRVEKLVLVSSGMGNPGKYMHLEFIKYIAGKFLDFIGWLLFWQSRRQYIMYRHGESKHYWHSVWIGLNTMPLTVNMWLLKMQFAELDFKDILPRIKAPVLMVKGAKDPFLSQREAEDMLKLLPHAELISSPELGHFVASRSPQALADIILRYLLK